MSLRFFANTTTAIGNVLTTNYSRVQLGNFAVDTNQITLSAWVNVIDWGPTGSDPRIILKQNVASTYSAGQDRFQWFLGLNRESTADRPKTLRARFNYSATTILGNTPLINNKWHHAVAVYNGGTASLYLDGNLEITSSAFNSTPLTADTGLEYPVMLGNNGANTSGVIQPNAFNGHIAHPTIWNSALTADEILSLSLGLTSIKVKPANIVSYLGTKNIDIFRDPTIQAFNVVDSQIEPRIILGSRKQLKIKGRNRFVGVIVSPTVSVTAISSSSIQVSVTAAPTQGSVITSYLIQRSTAQDFTSNLEQFSTPNFEDFSLNPLTTYYYRARFTQSDGRISDWSETKFASTPDIDDPETGDLDLAAPTMTAISEFYESTDVTPITPIQLPTVTLSNATQNSINVNVAAVPVTGQTITSYLIQRTTTPNVADSWQQVFTGVNSSFTNTDLNPSTLYHYRARFTQSDGRISDFSQSKSLATTQLIAPPPPNELVYPRLAAYWIGPPQNYDLQTFQQGAAKYDLVIWNNWETWGSGRSVSFAQMCANVKALNPNIKIFQYLTTDTPTYPPVGADAARPILSGTINTQNWWLRTSYPSGTVVVDPKYDNAPVTTQFANLPNKINGQSYIQWLMTTYVRDMYVNGAYQATPGFPKPNPNLDGFFWDNIFLMPDFSGDYNCDGTSDSRTDPTVGRLYREGIISGRNAYKAMFPNLLIAGNTVRWNMTFNPSEWQISYPIPEYNQKFDVGLVEHFTGKDFSTDEWGTSETLISATKKHADQHSRPDLQICQSDVRYTLSSFTYQDFRYAMSAALCVSDGHFGYFATSAAAAAADPEGFSGWLQWFDEYDNAGKQKHYLGTAIDPRVTTPWLSGVYRRRFANGWVLWNPRGNSVKTVQLGQSMKKIQGRSGFSDLAVNNGATVTQVTLQDRDGIILLNADVLVTIPSPPSALSTLATSTTQITLSWTDNSNNEVGFKIERSTNGVNFSQIATVAANITSYTDNNLSASTTYTYRVRSYNSAGDSTSSNNSSATTQAGPEALFPRLSVYWIGGNRDYGNEINSNILACHELITLGWYDGSGSSGPRGLEDMIQVIKSKSPITQYFYQYIMTESLQTYTEPQVFDKLNSMNWWAYRGSRTTGNYNFCVPNKYDYANRYYASFNAGQSVIRLRPIVTLGINNRSGTFQSNEQIYVGTSLDVFNFKGNANSISNTNLVSNHSLLNLADVETAKSLIGKIVRGATSNAFATVSSVDVRFRDLFAELAIDGPLVNGGLDEGTIVLCNSILLHTWSLSGSFQANEEVYVGNSLTDFDFKARNGGVSTVTVSGTNYADMTPTNAMFGPKHHPRRLEGKTLRGASSGATARISSIRLRTLNADTQYKDLVIPIYPAAIGNSSAAQDYRISQFTQPNLTTYAPKDPITNLGPSEWLVEFYYNKYLRNTQTGPTLPNFESALTSPAYAPSLTGIYVDQGFFGPDNPDSDNANYSLTGNLQSSDTLVRQAWRRDYRKGIDRIRGFNIKASINMALFVGAPNYTKPDQQPWVSTHEYYKAMDGGILEFYFGDHPFGFERYQSPSVYHANVTRSFRDAWNSVNDTKHLVNHCVSMTGDIELLVYTLGYNSVLGDAFAYIVNGGINDTGPPSWLDEMSVNRNTGTCFSGFEDANVRTGLRWLGTALEPGMAFPDATGNIPAAYQKGVIRRRFQYGEIYVNPRGNGRQDITLPGARKKLIGTQRPLVNDGKTVTTLDMPERSAVFLLFP